MPIPWLSHDSLLRAWEHVRENGGCAGVDGVTVDRFARDVESELQSLRERVQESVFQCRIDATLAEEMLTRVQRTIEENTDKVHVISLCDACGGKVTLYGIAKEATDPEYVII